jgi:hypothetical protein
MRTWVYIDGFNLYYAIRRLGCKWLDLKAFAQKTLPAGCVVEKVRYFTAHVSGAADPGQPQRQQQYLKALSSIHEVDVFFGNFLAKPQWRPLLNLPVGGRLIQNGVGVPLATPACDTYAVMPDPTNANPKTESMCVDAYGNGAKSPKPDAIKVKVFTMEEKGSDVNLAVHLVNDAWAGKFDAAAVVSLDTDLVEPIRIVAQDLKKPVWVLAPPGRPASRKLASASSGLRHIHAGDLKGSLLPDPVVLADGTTVHKPAAW